MSLIHFLDSTDSGCKAPVLPIIEQVAEVTFNTALDGTVPTVILPTNAAGLVPYAGSFVNKGCEDLLVTISYVGGGDCLPCNNPDALTTTDLTWTIPANSVTEIPGGFWTQISYVLENAANDNKLQYVSFNSAYSPDCPSCAIALADVA